MPTGIPSLYVVPLGLIIALASPLPNGLVRNNICTYFIVNVNSIITIRPRTV